jgi:hypothetical protein
LKSKQPGRTVVTAAAEAPDHADRWRVTAGGERPMTPLRFRRALDELDVWSARSDRYSFVITYGSPNGPGFHGSAGYLASWRSVHPSSFAVKIIGSPFTFFASAEEACNMMLKVLDERR